jgi:hypothetical protein
LLQCSLHLFSQHLELKAQSLHFIILFLTLSIGSRSTFDCLNALTNKSHSDSNSYLINSRSGAYRDKTTRRIIADIILISSCVLYDACVHVLFW